MKRIFILVTVLAVIAAGCKNYDDRFDDLNGQIATLTTQVQALQGVATQVTALNTEIGNIRSSIQEDIRTAVAGVSTTLNTSLTNAQTTLNGEIAKLQTALNDAAENSLSQDDIAKLKSELQTTLAAAQKTALDTALETLQAKLTELEKTLATAASGALSQADLDKLKQEIETQLAQVKKDLEESLGEGGFHSGSVTITSSGGWEATKRQLGSKTEFSIPEEGKFEINTKHLSATEVDELIAWVAEITLIHGTLKITHTGKEKVIKFAKLSSVTDLDDSQLHAHYPELTSAGVITLDGKIETVKLPKLTTLKGFAGHSIDLDEGTELTLSALASYNAEGLENLIIDLGGSEATIDLSALKNVYSLKDDGTKKEDKTLTIIGPDEVSLPELTTLALLHVKDVRSVSAPKVKAANLQINEDVVSVDVGTAEGAHINTLTFTNANDLETLQIGGNPATTNKGTVVTLNAQNTPDLERAHIHGGRSLVINGLNDFEEIITARTITENVTIRNTGIEGALVLGHESGDNGGLTVEYNDDIESLTADKLNKLSRLYIKGNHDLEKISFAALKAAGNQKTGTPWYNSDAVVIGGTQFDAADRGRGENYLEADRNNLIADAIHLEVKTGPTKQDPKIVDSSGLSTLKDFLASATFGVVSYDGAKSFRRIGGDSEALEDQENAKGDDFVLWREGLKGTPSDAGKAKRVFLTPSGLRTESSASITIGVAGEFYETITFQQGGSARNWVQQIKDAEVVKFFKDNDVTLDAVVGGAPSGNFQVDTREQAEITPSAENNFDTDGNIGDMNTDNDVQGSFKLTIGDYSHEVILEPATDPVKEDVPFYDPGDGTPQKPEKKNKKAITYLDSDAHWGPGDTPSTSTIEQLVYILISAFPDGTVTTNLETTYPRAVDAWKSVPYGINDLGDANGGTNLRTAIIYTLDPQYIAKPIKVDFKGHLKISKTGRDTRFLRHEGGNSARRVVTTDIKNNETRIQVTLTSDVAGKGDKSTIGHPPTTGNSSPDWLVSAIDPSQNSNAGEGYVSSSGGYSVTEYHVNPDKSTVLRRASSLPKVGTDSVTRTGGDANLNRLGWL